MGATMYDCNCCGESIGDEKGVYKVCPECWATTTKMWGEVVRLLNANAGLRDSLQSARRAEPDEIGQLRAELQQAKQKANELWRAKVQGLAGCPYPEEWTP